MTAPVQFNNTYALLPNRFFACVPPTPVGSPRLIELNAPLADQLGLDPTWLSSPAGVEMLAGNTLPPTAEPIATAYAGHQFGGFVPQLGDGRAILLGEVIGRDGKRRDIQLKGSGPTPFSRRGDGRAALGPVLREYIVSETMHRLGIPTTRALAAVTTGEKVFRETVLPGAVLTRVAASHIRVGTFQFFASRDDTDGVRVLADYVISRHYPKAVEAGEKRYLDLLGTIVAAQAELIAQWLLVGFIHGVMNTDNMSVAGETIDYGPCAFLDEYKPDAVYSYIDRSGRYAYSNQPAIAQWNLARLAECLLPLLAEDSDTAVAQATEALEKFAPQFDNAYRRGLRRKLGLLTEREEDKALGHDLLQLMAENRADFTLTFRRLADATLGPEHDEPVRSLFVDPAAFDPWVARWRTRLATEPAEPAERCTAMRAVNPSYIPRNHLIEAVIRAGEDRDDFEPLRELLQVLSKPFADQPEVAARYGQPPQEHERVLQTFCGT